MAKGVTGVNKVISELRKFGAEAVKKIDQATEAAAFNIAEDAQKRAPVDNGKLQQNINHLKVKDSQYKITVNVPYAAYIEFGTGTKVKVPSGWENLAASFKGKTGQSYDDGLEAIKIWCKRHGIDEKMAKWIFLKILKVGINPQPFLYPAWFKGKKDYLNNLERMLKNYKRNI